MDLRARALPARHEPGQRTPMTPGRWPRVSVLIVTYNYGAFIEEAVESVLGQTLPSSEVELIVVDDGSTDDTRVRLERYGNALQYVYKENGGQASAWNAGFARSRGEIVALLDSDDVWYRDKLVRVMAEFDESPEVDVVAHAMTVLDARGAVIGELPDRRLHGPGAGERRPLQSYLRGKLPCLPPTSGLAVRSACLARITPIPEEFRGGRRGPGVDEYLAKVLPFYAREFGFLAQSLGAYRVHGPDSWTARGTQHTEATVELYRQTWLYVERAANELGYDCSQLRRKFEALTHEAEIQLYALRRQRLKALRHALRFEDPEFGASGVLRTFRRVTQLLSILMPRGAYVSLRERYRRSRAFELVHRKEWWRTRGGGATPDARRRPE